MIRANFPSTARDASRALLLRRSYEIAERRGCSHAVDISRRYPSRLIDYHKALGVDDSQPLGNISFCELEDWTYLVSVRQFGYDLLPMSAKLKWIGGNQSSRGYHMLVADREFNFIRKINVDIKGKTEDIRLMRYGDVVQASYTRLDDGVKGPRAGCSKIKIEGDTAKFYDEVIFQTPNEKNYIPIEREDGAGVFISDLLAGEIKIATSTKPSDKDSRKCIGIIPYRGSTPLLKYGEEYVSLVHRRNGHRFFNAFAFFDKNLLVCRISDEFTVFRHKSPVSFCCGMAVEGDVAVLPVCIHDRDTYLFKIPVEDFRKTAKLRS